MLYVVALLAERPFRPQVRAAAEARLGGGVERLIALGSLLQEAVVAPGGVGLAPDGALELGRLGARRPGDGWRHVMSQHGSGAVRRVLEAKVELELSHEGR